MRARETLLFAVLVALLAVQPASSATIKPASACKKLGAKVVQSGMRYECVRVNGKLVWSKGKRVVTPLPTASIAASPVQRWLNVCQHDPQAGNIWGELQTWLKLRPDCERPVRIVDVPLPSSIPITSISDSTSLQSINDCKLPDNPAKDFNEGFPSAADAARFKATAHPGPNTVYQLVPITSPDAPTRGRTPEQDYGRYFDFLKAWTASASDAGSSAEFRIPKAYVPVSVRVAPFGIDHHEDAASRKLAAAILTEVDKEIDFSGVTNAIVVVPAGTAQSVLWQGQGGTLLTAETSRVAFMFAPPYTFDSTYLGRFRTMSQPIVWLHELYHGRGVLDDHVGANQWGVATADNGTGQWGLMSTAMSDLLGWEKWLLGFWSDAQIRCSPKDVTTTSWLIPSTIHGELPKLAVVRLSPTRVLIAESIRAAGLNFKLPTAAQGLLVYVLDTSDTRRDFGYRVLRADGARAEVSTFEYSDAPLAVGEHITVDGVRVTVVEAGEFGDVIRIEPAA